MPLGASVSVLGTAGDWYQIQYAGQTGYVLGTYLSLGASAPVGSGSAELVDWWAEGKSIMSSGTLATVTDVATGISFQIRCMSAGNHADVEPLTAEDSAKILQIRGKYSWTPRAVRVTVNGRVLAASCNGMPHSVSTIKNNDFGGHFCIHFAGSRNHYNNKADPDHQKQVQVAFNS
jgi:hypothetical protein